MGHIHPRSLYLDCLHDLASGLPESVVRRLRDDNNASIEPWPDISHREMASLKLLTSVLKKFQDDIDQSATDKPALEKFLSVNERCRDWSYQPESTWDEVLMGELRSVVYDFFYPDGDPLITSSDQIFDRVRSGPGSSIGSSSTDFYTKFFESDLSTSSIGLYRAYRNYIKRLPEWEIAEQFRLSSFGMPTVVSSNRLRFVPKTRDISRSICIEPTLNMGYQLGLGSLIEDRLRSFFGIDLSLQPDINRELSRRGSIDGAFCTIDLESASDSMSLRMLHHIVPSQQLAWFLVGRSANTELPDGHSVKLHMISTMGNGYTFPLQTMLFASIVTAAARARDFFLGRPRGASDCTFGVFGDDIIVPTGAHYERKRKLFVNYSEYLSRSVLRLLNITGFVVNSSKSFFEGPFRESCGYDSFRGHNVRGVYLKSLRTTHDRYSAINAFNDWTARTGIPLPRVVHTLLRTVPKRAIPRADDSAVGIRVPFSFIRRYVRHRDTGAILYRTFIAKSRRVNLGEQFQARSKCNPSGLLIAFLNGTIRSGTIVLRSKDVKYRNLYSQTPWWDFPGYGHKPDPGEATLWYLSTVPELSSGGQRWDTAVSLNIGRVTFEA